MANGWEGGVSQQPLPSAFLSSAAAPYLQCQRNVLGIHDCTHTEDVGLTCAHASEWLPCPMSTAPHLVPRCLNCRV
jgi:hypothetical protein